MGNNSEPRAEDGLPQQVNNSGNERRLKPRGLMPSDGQEAYRSMRASKRSRNDRLSYLVATGHMDPEETEALNKPMGDLITTVPALYSDTPSTTAYKAAIRHQNSDNNQLTSQSKPHTSLNITTKRSNFDPSFLHNLNHTLANSPVASNHLLQQQQHYDSQQQQQQQQQQNIFGPSSSSPLKRDASSSKKRKNKSRKQKSSPSALSTSARNKNNSTRSIVNVYTNQGTTNNENHNDRKFRQTFTEVTLPMKTSPAFEYILRDNERRNKRCCLWFLYSTLVTLCIAIILFSSIHLLMRSQNRN